MTYINNENFEKIFKTEIVSKALKAGLFLKYVTYGDIQGIVGIDSTIGKEILSIDNQGVYYFNCPKSNHNWLTMYNIFSELLEMLVIKSVRLRLKSEIREVNHLYLHKRREDFGIPSLRYMFSSIEDGNPYLVYTPIFSMAELKLIAEQLTLKDITVMFEIEEVN